jgi:hypothetical protein
VRREPTLPIGVWLPTLAALVVGAWILRSERRTPSLARAPSPSPVATPVASHEAPPAVASAPPPRDPTTVEVPGGAVADAATPHPTPLEPPHDAPHEPAHDPPPEAAPPKPAWQLPPGWSRLDTPAASSFDASPFGRAASSWTNAARARLGERAATLVTSGAALAPLVVVTSDGDAASRARVEAIAQFGRRFHDELLAPTRLLDPPQDAVPVLVGVELEGGEPLLRRDARVEVAADTPLHDLRAQLARRWLAERLESRATTKPPRWWREGAVEAFAAASFADALAAADRDEPTLAALLAPEPAEDEEPLARARLRRAAGSFAAWCLDGGDHLRSTWLEFARAPAADGDELAQRFGAASELDLEREWSAARRRAALER